MTYSIDDFLKSDNITQSPSNVSDVVSNNNYPTSFHVDTALRYGQVYRSVNSAEINKTIEIPLDVMSVESGPLTLGFVEKQKEIKPSLVFNPIAVLDEEKVREGVSIDCVGSILCLKSNFSEVVQFNNLRTPSLNGVFVYNFFTSDESDIDKQESETNKVIDNFYIQEVPKYIQLNWDKIFTINELTDIRPLNELEKNLKKSIFIDTSNAGASIVFENGEKLSIIDAINLEEAVLSTNNINVFKNTVDVVFNTEIENIDDISVNNIIKSGI